MRTLVKPAPPVAPAAEAVPANTYDQVPYLSSPFPQTHPQRLATVAALFGLSPAPPERCRVLELGCASGGNLIPMAVGLPESTFVGIDLSARQVALGRKTIAALGITNVELRHASILDVGEADGPFDYVVAHGIYSWVPDEVKEKILQINANLLRPDGVGCISYNTFPGWRVRGILRDLMFYHLNRSPDAAPPGRIARARAVVESLGKPATPYGRLLAQELELFRTIPNFVVFHNHLEDPNDPVYFSEFVRRLTDAGLGYLGDAEPWTMMPWDLAPLVRQMAGGDLDQVAMEQYLDFLRNRAFRQTLVCRPEHRPNWNLRAGQAASFHAASPLRPASAEPDLKPGVPERFVAPGGLHLESTDPILKAALLCLAESWPLAVPFDELLQEARVRLAGAFRREAETMRKDAEALGQSLVMGFLQTTALVELWPSPPRCVGAVSRRPEACPLARLQAGSGLPVTNRRHQTVGLGELDRRLLPLLDGTRDRPALLAGLVGQFREGVLAISLQKGGTVTDEETARGMIAQALDEQLPRLAANSLLVA